MEMDLSRHIEVFNPSKVLEPIHIIGVGATGSFVAMELARLGCPKLYLYDKDDVGIHNIPNQYFETQDIGKLKVDALKEKLLKINPNIIVETTSEFVTPEDISKMSGYVFMLVDVMSTRKQLWEAAKTNPNIKVVWESRLGSDQARVYCLPIKKNQDYKRYEQDFYGDDVSEKSACGTSITVLPIVLQTASFMICQFINIVMDYNNPIYFKTIFDNFYNKYEEDWNGQVGIEEEPIVQTNNVVLEDLF